jgi:hypothetical protein
MTNESGDRSSLESHDCVPANRRPWVAPKVIASELSLTAGAAKPPKEPHVATPRGSPTVS